MADFTNGHGSTFKEANQLIKLIVLKHPLMPNRQVELTSACLDWTCSVNHSEGRNNIGVTPLYWACKTGQDDTALLLLGVGASVNNLTKRTDGNQTSPLFWAAKNVMNKVVGKLLDLNVDITTVAVMDGANDKIKDMIRQKMAAPIYEVAQSTFFT